MPESLVKLLHLGHWSQDAGNLLQRKEVWKLLEGSIGPTGPSMLVDGSENLMVDHHFPHCRGNKIGYLPSLTKLMFSAIQIGRVRCAQAELPMLKPPVAHKVLGLGREAGRNQRRRRRFTEQFLAEIRLEKQVESSTTIIVIVIVIAIVIVCYCMLLILLSSITIIVRSLKKHYVYIHK